MESIVICCTEATIKCRTFIELPRAERTDKSVSNEIYQSVLDLSETYEIVENMPRRYSRQTTRANHLANTPKQYGIVSLYFACIDRMIMKLESRLISPENCLFAQYLLPRVERNITNQQIATFFRHTRLTWNAFVIYTNSVGRSLDSKHDSV